MCVISTLIIILVVSVTSEAKSITLGAKLETYKTSNVSNYKERIILPSRFNKMAMDCQELHNNGHNASGVYSVYPRSRLVGFYPVKVYCDMDTDGGGWTVIQRRGDFKRPMDYFYKSWNEYKDGFGSLQKDFWLGNDIIFALTNQDLYSVRFDLKDFDGNSRYAVYDEFWIDDEHQNYKLHIKDYSGDAGDSISYHDNMKFSTKDRKNDLGFEPFSCAEDRKGGWWYNSCAECNLNGMYRIAEMDDNLDAISWYKWRGNKYSLSSAEIKIRPQITILRSA